MNSETSLSFFGIIKDYFSNHFLENLVFFVLGLVLLFIAKIARDRLTVAIDDDSEITSRDNVAFGIYTAGYYLGFGLTLIGIFVGEELSFGQNVLDFIQYGITGIVLMGMSYVITDKFYLPSQKSMFLLLEKNNAVAIFISGRFVYTGLNVLAATIGEGTWFLTFVYFILGEIGCWLGFAIYKYVTPYDDIKDIIAGKEAVGIACSGYIVALGILILSAFWGDFEGYQMMLFYFFSAFVGGNILLLLFRTIGGKLLFPKSTLVVEVHKDNNKGAAVIMATVYIIISTIIVLSF